MVKEAGARLEIASGPEISRDRVTELGGVPIRRALPRRDRRTIGAWCFIDHLGPSAVALDSGFAVGPHPHLGLQTVTWLVAGEQVHRDSLGSEQPIRPGQLNVMTAGWGVAHAEDTETYRGPVHGLQLWVAQPETTRHGPPAFEHHPVLPRVELGSGVATVMCGSFDGHRSPARTDTELVGVDLDLHAGTNLLPLHTSFEHGLVVLDGSVTLHGPAPVDGPVPLGGSVPVGGSVSLDGQVVEPGFLAYLGPGRSELAISAAADTRALLIGGVPFPETVLMWWNFVGRTRAEMEVAAAEWAARDDRFGRVRSPLTRIDAPPLPWNPTSARQ
jgi:redox-sensitive bicupin YhaK (pirin superfamily)